MTPADISAPHVIAFCREIEPRAEPIQTLYRPAPGAPERECFPIVQQHANTHGGELVTGWAIWEWPGVFIEAEFHGVWRSPEGLCIDLTPRRAPYERTTFLPAQGKTFNARQVDNIRRALVQDPDVKRYLFLHSQVFNLLNAGDLANQIGQVMVPRKTARRLEVIQRDIARLDMRLKRRYLTREANPARLEK